MTEQTELELSENPFKGLQSKQSQGTVFDKNITFTLGGKEQSIYEFTQANREDTEIYPTLEKYGTIERMTRPLQDIYGDATKMKDLRATFEEIKEGEKIWNNIPLDIREQFGNDMGKFVKHGQEWAQNEMKKQQEATTQTNTEGATNNE